MREFIPGALNGLAGIITLGLCILSPWQVSIDLSLARTAGSITIAAGLLLAIWATAHIRSAILAEVTPRLPHLVQSGPYALVRHPVYLGMTVALLGAALFTRSWPGAVATLLFFLPTEIYRARLEEGALARRFGSEWHSYAKRTGFFLPQVGRLTR